MTTAQNRRVNSQLHVLAVAWFSFNSGCRGLLFNSIATAFLLPSLPLIFFIDNLSRSYLIIPHTQNAKNISGERKPSRREMQIWERQRREKPGQSGSAFFDLHQPVPVWEILFQNRDSLPLFSTASSEYGLLPNIVVSDQATNTLNSYVHIGCSQQFPGLSAR